MNILGQLGVKAKFFPGLRVSTKLNQPVKKKINKKVKRK